MGKEQVNLTIQCIRRLPYYLQFLRDAQEQGTEYISATTIAAGLELNDVVVRKDISSVCATAGKPKVGFAVKELITGIKECLGYHNLSDAVLVGAGSLGHALLANQEFEKNGLNIVTAFDIDPSVVGKTLGGKKILHLSKLKELCGKMHIHIGIITTPAQCAQEICDMLVEVGVKAIWNFALVKLSVPEDVLVQNENLAASLAVLSRHLKEQMTKQQREGH